MIFVDMHCDSLLRVSSGRGLVNEYNVSGKHAYLQFFAAFVPARAGTAEESRHILMRLADAYISEVQRLNLVSVRSPFDVCHAVEHGLPSALFSIEGGAGLYADSEELKTLRKMGLSVMGLTWDSNHLASSAWDKIDTGLTREGKKMVERLSEYGIIVDTSHMSDKAFYDTLECTSYPVIATHSNFRDVCNSPRNLTLDMARQIKSRGGIIGLNIYPPFLSDSGRADESDILRHVDYALTNLGEDALAFGFDIDGTDGEYPEGYGEYESMHDKVFQLLCREYGDAVAEKIAGLNAIRFLKENL